MVGSPRGPEEPVPRDRRGVSDLLGFAVVFGIVVLSISLLYTVGTATLTSIQHDHAVDNTERAFDILANNVEDISTNGAPGRDSELQLASGQLALSGTTTVTITNTTVVSDGPVAITVRSTDLRYSRQERGIDYAAGAVIRTHRDQAVLAAEPNFRFDRTRTLVSLVEAIPAGDSRSVGGTGSILVSTRSEGSTIERIVSDHDTDVELTVTTPHPRAWERYFDGQPIGSTTLDAENQTVTYAFTTDELLVRRTAVRVRLTT